MSSPPDQHAGGARDGIHVDIGARGIATITLSRPERGNAYHAPMLDALGDACAALAADAAVRVVVLRGAGKHFCVGADLAQDASAPAPRRPLPDVCAALDALPKPTVAVVHGGCIGGGLAWAACCDVLLADRGAFFALPEVRIGFAPAPLTPVFLRAIGARALRRYGLTGERFGADEALRVGLAHQLFDSGQADVALARLTDELLHGAPGAQAEFKAVIARIHALPAGASLPAHVHTALQAGFARGRASAEAAEGRAAFRDKRRPSWNPEPSAT